MIPGMIAYLIFTFVLGINTYSPVNIPHVSMKGISLTINFISGANNTKSSIFFSIVVMKIEIPLDNTINNGRSKRMEK